MPSKGYELILHQNRSAKESRLAWQIKRSIKVKVIFSLFQEIDEISLIVIKREEEREKTSSNFQAYLPNIPSSLTSDTKTATTKIALANCVVVIMIIIINKLLVGICTGRNLLER